VVTIQRYDFDEAIRTTGSKRIGIATLAHAGGKQAPLVDR
jgi:hypothetical protein